METSSSGEGKEHKRVRLRRNESAASEGAKEHNGRREREYVIHAGVNVPVYCQFRVKAANKKEALAKAMRTEKGEETESEWESHIWQEGNWIKNVQWTEAEDFRILGVDRDNGTKTINR